MISWIIEIRDFILALYDEFSVIYDEFSVSVANVECPNVNQNKAIGG